MRPKVTEMVKELRERGIKVIMATSDNAVAARAVAIQTGIISQPDKEYDKVKSKLVS